MLRLGEWWFEQKLESFKDATVNAISPEAKFVASNLWFHRFKARARFRQVKLSSGAASADKKAAEFFP